MQTDTSRCRLKRLPFLPFYYNELFFLRAKIRKGASHGVDLERKGESVHISELSHLQTNERREGWDDAWKPNTLSTAIMLLLFFQTNKV